MSHSTDELDQIAVRLSPRDHAVLADIDRFRFLTTTQIEALHFSQHRTQLAGARISRRCLLRLRELHLIEPLERRIGGLRAGSASFVWQIGVVGDRLLRQGHPERPRARRKQPSLRYLDHRLAVADVHVTLSRAGQAGHFELLLSEPEPATWRTFMGSLGTRETLKPDLIATTATDDFEDWWFIEIDRATESLPTVLKKCLQYERYRRTGQEQQTHGVFPLVVWAVPDVRRQTVVREAIQADRHLDDSLFKITQQADVVDCLRGVTP